MGSWGADTPKPTVLFGTVWEAQWQRCIVRTTQKPVATITRWLRTWGRQLYRRMTKELRMKLLGRMQKRGKALVRVYYDKAGSRKVSATQPLLWYQRV